MLEWLLLLSIAALGGLAFAILFKATPSDTHELHGEKLRSDLTKMANQEEKKRREEQRKKAEKAVEKKQQKQKVEEPTRKEEVEWEERPATKEVFVPNVPIFNNTPTTKAVKDPRARSPTKEEKTVKKEVAMPSKKQIERDMGQGFVVVQKKGPPPLTEDQKKEREELRKQEEELERKRAQDELTREMELKEARLKRAAEGTIVSDGSQEAMLRLKEKLEKEKAEKLAEKEKAKGKAGGVVKVCNIRSAGQDGEEAEGQAQQRVWTAATAREGEEAPAAFDNEDYPSL